MEIQSFYEPDSGTWTHLLADPAEKVAAVIDPVWVYDPVSGMADATFIEGVLTQAEDSGYRVEWVLETHAHADHLTAAGLVRARTGALLACGRGICSVQENFVRVFNMTTVPTDGRQFDRLLSEGDILELGAIRIRVMETPGHTSDSVTYIAGDAAFIGDTLFAPAYGSARCDFPGGDAGLLFDSICRLYELPSDTRLFLCHDYPGEGNDPVSCVTVEESRKNNVHVSTNTSKDEFVSMRTGRDSKLGLPRLIIPSLQVNILGGSLPDADSNGVSYLRTPFSQSIADLIKGEPR
jgi:glyoxylase-like metal-dependent hydrolase (beta-lactamase superfamily II)